MPISGRMTVSGSGSVEHTVAIRGAPTTGVKAVLCGYHGGGAAGAARRAGRELRWSSRWRGRRAWPQRGQPVTFCVGRAPLPVRVWQREVVDGGVTAGARGHVDALVAVAGDGGGGMHPVAGEVEGVRGSQPARSASKLLMASGGSPGEP